MDAPIRNALDCWLPWRTALLRGWAMAALLAAPMAWAQDLATPADVANPVQAAVSLLDADRPAALTALRTVWEDASHPQRGAAAVALAKAMLAGDERAELPALALSMLDSGALAAEQAVLVFVVRMAALEALKQWPDDDTALRDQADVLSAAVPAGDLRAQPWRAVGKGQLSLGRFNDAELAFRNALRGFEGAEPTALMADYQRDLGVALAQQGKLDESLETFLASQATREALGLADSPDLLGNMAGLYLYMERWDRALELSERAIAASPPESPARARYINNAGSALFGMEKLDEARARFEESLALSERTGQPGLSALNNLAFVLLKQGETRAAQERFEQIAAIAAAGKDLNLLGVATKNIGETWIALGDRARADGFLQRAREIYAETDNRPKAVELYPVLIDNLEKLGRHGEALQRMREFKAMNDEMNSVASNERIAKLEANAELKRKEAELVVQKSELALKQAEVDRLNAQETNERLQRNGLIGAIVALGLILILLVRHLVHRARAHRELLRKNAEIDAHRERLQQLNDVVRRQNEEDALTGLYNRRHLQALLDRRAAGTGDAAPVLAIVADLDHFKRINDEFGHPAGDQVLKHVADVLRGCQRAGDELIRWGGEEFIWLCRGATEAQAPELCARLQDALARNPTVLEGRPLALTASLGFAAATLWPGRAPDVDLAIRLADQAAYGAKAAGRNTWMGYRAGSTPPADVDLDRCPTETMEREGWVTRMAA